MNPNRTRTVAVAVIVVAFVALAAFALAARSYRPGRDGVEVPSAAIAQSAASVLGTLPDPTSRVLGTNTNADDDVIETAAPAAPAPTSNPAPAPTAPEQPNPGNGLAPCPLGLEVPQEQAGLANMVGLVPLFGPFSPEAFAFVPAFEPGFPLMGPLIIEGGEQLDAHEAEMAMLVSVLRPLQQAGFDTISPFYSPYRQQFLEGEAALAEAIRPGVAAFAAAPGASCFPAMLALVLS